MQKPTDILLVEDEEAHAELIRRSFADHSELSLVVATTIARARELIAAAPPRLVLSDLMLPDGRGIDLLRGQDGREPPPLVLLTSHGDEKVAVEAIKAGALDYVVKSAETLGGMPAVAARALREWNHVLERRRAEAEVRDAVDALRALYLITSGAASFEAKLGDLLRLGCARLGLGRGVLARVSGDDYEVRAVYPGDGVLARGLIRPLGQSISRTTWRGGEPVHLGDAAAEHRHPCCTDRRLAGYAGVAVLAGGEPIGVLEFLSESAPASAFHSTNDELLKLMAQWIGAEQARQQADHALREAEQKFLHSQRLEAVGRLASGVAHDYNNLLMGIGGCVDLALKKMDGGAPARLYLEEAKRAAARGTALTRQLLVFSRPRRGDPVDLDLGTAVRNTEKMIRAVLGEGVTVTIELGAGDWLVRVDEGQVAQVLMNLVINARDAMGGSGALRLETGQLTVSAGGPEGRPPPGGYVTLTVSDTGCGMDPATQARIFEPFFTTKGSGQGTGIGLATVRSIVEEAGGTIAVWSEKGKGSRFSISLPRAEAVVSAPSPVAVPETPRQGTETVLVVEDQQLVRITVRSYLEEWGHAVLEAGDVEQALGVAEAHPGPIHLLLSDVALPGGSAADVVRRLSTVRPGLKVLYMSAHPRDVLVASRRIPADATLLLKPFGEETLREAVRQILGE